MAAGRYINVLLMVAAAHSPAWVVPVVPVRSSFSCAGGSSLALGRPVCRVFRFFNVLLAPWVARFVFCTNVFISFVMRQRREG